jgi:hypothetical protein
MALDTDSYELGYLRTMTTGLAEQLEIAIVAHEWDFVSMIANELKKAPADAEAKAAARYGKAAA